MAAASPHPTRRTCGDGFAHLSYTARYPRRFASSTPPHREEVKSMTHLKSRMARVAWTLASLAALGAALGAGRKWH